MNRVTKVTIFTVLAAIVITLVGVNVHNLYSDADGVISAPTGSSVSSSTSTPDDSASSSTGSETTSSDVTSSGTTSSEPPAKTELEILRETYIYQAVKMLNIDVDFTNPDAYGQCTYNTNYVSGNGFEVKNGKPDYEQMKKLGLCCASFVNYYLFNYLPNEAGISTGIEWKTHPDNPANDLHVGKIRANSVAYTMEQSNWIGTYNTARVKGKDYSYVEQDFKDGKLKYNIGDVIILSSTNYQYHHVGIYAGYYNGQHWIAHSTNTPKGVGVTLSPYDGYSRTSSSGVKLYVTGIFTPPTN